MYLKEVYVFDQNKPVKAVIRNYQEKDFAQLIRVQKECFPPPFPSELWWNEEQLKNHVDFFPEGALCVEIAGNIAGSITGLRVNYTPGEPDHSWEQITDNGYIRNHQPEGNTLYVVDISVSPTYRKLGLGKLLMQSMYEVVIQNGMDRLLGGGRMPHYHKYENEMSAEDYLEQVISGDIKDPVITFLLHCGRTPVKVVKNYLEDEDSRNHATLMEWKNPFKQ